MTEVKKKGIGKAKVGLAIFAILAVILTMSNILVYVNLQNQINSLETDNTTLHSQMNTLQTEKSSLESQLETLQSQFDDYVANHHYTDSEYNALKSAKLIKVNLHGSDHRPWLQTPYLHITGEVVNVGTDTAYSCKLHVFLYQGEVVAEDTYINLGTISGEGYKSVDSKVYYEGEALTHWSITPVWV